MIIKRKFYKVGNLGFASETIYEPEVKDTPEEQEQENAAAATYESHEDIEFYLNDGTDALVASVEQLESDFQEKAVEITEEEYNAGRL